MACLAFGFGGCRFLFWFVFLVAVTVGVEGTAVGAVWFFELKSTILSASAAAPVSSEVSAFRSWVAFAFSSLLTLALATTSAAALCAIRGFKCVFWKSSPLAAVSSCSTSFRNSKKPLSTRWLTTTTIMWARVTALYKLVLAWATLFWSTAASRSTATTIKRSRPLNLSTVSYTSHSPSSVVSSFPELRFVQSREDRRAKRRPGTSSLSSVSRTFSNSLRKPSSGRTIATLLWRLRPGKLLTMCMIPWQVFSA
mmetsp:Transcript_41629/g.81661  ORF Transcript_41629/g.81661 Transcript_41629/m.81661 type:complete len:253 (-) Transcript_41629:604-1362(-)